MSILEFQRPDGVIMVDSSPTRGVFEFRPLEPGYGITIGNALRRILLSSLEGYAITWLKMGGVSHEFSTIPGVVQDVTQIILNLKQLRFKPVGDTNEFSSERCTIRVSGLTSLSGGALNEFLTHFEVANPDLEICTLNPEVDLEFQINISRGRGYITSEENTLDDMEFGVIPIDSIHTPIRNVSYRVENYRVQQKTDYEKLTIEIETDGTINPKYALKEAASILISHFMLFSDDKITLIPKMSRMEREVDTFSQEMRQLLATKLVELDLSVRALNCLKAASIDTLADLVSKSPEELLKIRNFGKKSLAEVEDVLASMKLDFSMDISKYFPEVK